MKAREPENFTREAPIKVRLALESAYKNILIMLIINI